MMDRAEFYKSLKNKGIGVFGSSLEQGQVDGCECILNECQRLGLQLEKVAYVLATAYGETGGKMQPRRENMNYSANRIPQVFSASRRRGVPISRLAGNPKLLANTVYATTLGNRDGTNDGWQYRGAGLGQITGRANYKKWGQRLGIDLVGDPELLMDLDISVQALVTPMVEGWATGKLLDDYINDTSVDYVNARRVWNGSFEADKYAGYARAFEAALKMAGYSAVLPVEKPQDSAQSPWAAIIAALMALLRGNK